MVVIMTASGPDRAHQPVLPLVCWSQQRHCKGQLTRCRTAHVAQATTQLGLRNTCASYPMGSALPLSSFLPRLWCVSFPFRTFMIPWIVFTPGGSSLLFFFLLHHLRDHSSSTKDRTHTPCIGSTDLNHWTTREVPQVLSQSSLASSHHAGFSPWPVRTGTA